jgi:uncharacterized protein (DUF488 family)
LNTTLYTVGHSNHSLEDFVALLKLNAVTAICDVRSQPVSAYTPHFSREPLAAELCHHGIAYVFLGSHLGGRSGNKACYLNGRLQYTRVMREPTFATGIERVKNGMQNFRIALMCSEKDPLGCHRALLVGRHLFQEGINLQHILSTGLTESHSELESRLLELCNIPDSDMFRDRAACIADAYQIQGDRVAHADAEVAQDVGNKE